MQTEENERKTENEKKKFFTWVPHVVYRARSTSSLRRHSSIVLVRRYFSWIFQFLFHFPWNYRSSSQHALRRTHNAAFIKFLLAFSRYAMNDVLFFSFIRRWSRNSVSVVIHIFAIHSKWEWMCFIWNDCECRQQNHEPLRQWTQNKNKNTPCHLQELKSKLIIIIIVWYEILRPNKWLLRTLRSWK